MSIQVVTATEFKAKCLSLLEQVNRTGNSITVTKRGRPIATLGPAPRRLWRSSEGMWADKISIPDEVLMADTSDLWDVTR